MHKQAMAVRRVASALDRERTLSVLHATYRDEKRWVDDTESQFPAHDLDSAALSWFLACSGDEPVGVLRVHYAPPLAQYRRYQVKLLVPDLDVDAFLSRHRIAEIGRFAIIPSARSRPGTAVALMHAACRETLERGFSHYITDVFEDDPHSPYGFHTRVMGFKPVATHDTGELRCPRRRITLILDLKDAYQRLQKRGGWLFRHLTADWDDALHRRLGS